jgi:hypothetical protein
MDVCGLISDNKGKMTLPKAEFLTINLITRGKAFLSMHFSVLV